MPPLIKARRAFSALSPGERFVVGERFLEGFAYFLPVILVPRHLDISVSSLS